MVIKLTLDFQTELDVSTAFSSVCSMTKLIPFENGRAVAFGWGTQSGNYQNGPRYQYWLAEICQERVSHRILPVELTHRIEGLMAPLADDCYMQAFKLGEKFGLLLSTEAVLLFSGIHDEPELILIENHFSVFGEPRHCSHPHDSYFTPTHCGNAEGNFVPVVLRDPKGRANCGYHVCLLEIDQAAVCARWLHTKADGSPRATVLAEYAQSVSLRLPLAAARRYKDQQPRRDSA